MDKNELRSMLRLIIMESFAYDELLPGLDRLSELVRENDDFFSNPPIGARILDIVADKLEELIEADVTRSD